MTFDWKSTFKNKHLARKVTNTTMTPLINQKLIVWWMSYYIIMSTKCQSATWFLTRRPSLVTFGQKSVGWQSVEPTKPWPHYLVNPIIRSIVDYTGILMLYYNVDQMSVGYMVFDQKTQFGDFWSKTIWPTNCWTNKAMTPLFGQLLITL